MHRKAIFVLAGIFLVVALVVPPVILLLQSDNDLDNYIISQDPTHQTQSGNIILTPEEIQENHNTIFIVVLIVEVIFVALFAITMYYGVNHPHPEH